MTDQWSLNKYVPDHERRVPFTNMIYFGDGDTDVPCMKLTKVNGGHSIAVYQDDEREASKLIREGRVDFAFKADYSRGKKIEKTVFTIIDEIASMESLRAEKARQQL